MCLSGTLYCWLCWSKLSYEGQTRTKSDHWAGSDNTSWECQEQNLAKIQVCEVGSSPAELHMRLKAVWLLQTCDSPLEKAQAMLLPDLTNRNCDILIYIDLNHSFVTISYITIDNTLCYNWVPHPSNRDTHKVFQKNLMFQYVALSKLCGFRIYPLLPR